MKKPPFSVVVLNYNGRKIVGDCLESVFAQGYPSVEVVFVDNASTDGSLEMVRSAFRSKKIRYVSLKKNAGFTGGHNAGAKAASGKYVMLLSNDVRLKNGCLSRLAKEFEESKADVLGVNVSVPGDLEAGGRMGRMNYLGYNLHAPAAPVFYANGCAMCYRRESLAGRPPFDPDYFFYGEDIYFSWLARMEGKRIMQSDGASVVHLESVTNRSFRKDWVFYAERNRILNLLTFLSIKSLLKIWAPLKVAAFFRLAVALSKGDLFFRLRPYSWLMFNIPAILRKRRRIQARRRVPDSEIFPHTTWKLLPMASDGTREGTLDRAVNKLSRAYCKFLRIPAR